MIDLGCGPGQTTKFLVENGVTDIIGSDISPGMIAKAKELSPELCFQTADMLNLAFPNDYFGSAVSFYSIVHFNPEQLKIALSEVHRVLKEGGQFLVSFHVGTEIVHKSDFFGEAVDIDFFFFETDAVINLLEETGFEMKESIVRYAYRDVEFPSKRAYLCAEKKSDV